MYDVALLIEHQLEPLDADQVMSLHEGLDEPVTYHLLLPVESSTATMMSSMTAFGGQVLPPTEPDLVNDLSREVRRAGQAELEASVALLRERGQQVSGELAQDDPLDELVALAKRVEVAEVIVMTDSHAVRELLRMDWASRARRALDLPTLHLLEHVPFDAQAL
ncbi:hypothetical protein [Aeromicrobium massiliense]|uniref:hypothetical protein n=1 Tax=Aeromicrobium massiliense TaxID=1464554 RepID=UPI0002DDAC6F|nr:hypothetical protein [Aeromicrobium massiliense]